MSQHRTDYENWVDVRCPSGKRAHTSRYSAKRHAKALRERGEHLRPYRCDLCGYWHVGHLPDDVQRGIRSADSHYQRTPEQRGPQ